MGDKTQLATVALGARYASTALVTAGTTLGMLAADGLAVFAAVKLDRVVPIRWVRLVAAGLFFLFGSAPCWAPRASSDGARTWTRGSLAA